MANPTWKKDCRSFNSQYACDVLAAENYKDCSECKFYDPFAKKVLLIKLGAMGDVLRTTPLLPLIKKKYPNCHLTWLVKEESRELLKTNKEIDRVLPYSYLNILRLQQEKFDILINLEISAEATLLANTVKAKEKLGYYFHESGNPSPFNKASEFYLNRVYSNQINKANRKTYQEMMAEIAELNYEKLPYALSATEEYSESFSQMHGLTKKDKLLGINIGSSKRWPSKAWHPDLVLEFSKRMSKEGYKILLLGGPEEQESLPMLHRKLSKERVPAMTNNPENTLQQFLSLVNRCNILVTADSLALHIAIGLKKTSLSPFFFTPPFEN